MKTLYCDSKGDIRFSALYAVVQLKNGQTTTIERYYQSVKRKADGTPCRKGEHVYHIIVNGHRHSATRLTELYDQLWELYFTQHPELLHYAATFDNFVDRFAGHSINTKAKSIAKCVNRYLNK